MYLSMFYLEAKLVRMKYTVNVVTCLFNKFTILFSIRGHMEISQWSQTDTSLLVLVYHTTVDFYTIKLFC
jgi:hypothetical protein